MGGDDTEVINVQRQIRLLQADLKRQTQDRATAIRKQRGQVERLTSENRILKAELNDARKIHSDKAANKSDLSKLRVLADQHETSLVDVQDTHNQVEILDSKLEQLGQRLIAVRKAAQARGGKDCADKETAAITKNLRMLENRLDRSLQSFNESVHENKELRDQIDALRRERIIFDKIYRGLENQLEQKKREMANIIEQANSAYEARDTAQTQVALLKAQADKEHHEFEREWRELGKLIENDKKMKEFMRKKQQDEKHEQRRAEGKKAVNAPVDKERKALEQEVSVDGQSLKGHQEAFAKIQAATGLNDIQDLITNFSHAEDTCYSLYNYANEQSGFIDQLKEDEARLDNEIIAMGGKPKKQSIGMQSKKDAEKKLEQLTEELKEQQHTYDAMLDSGLQGVQKATLGRELQNIKHQIEELEEVQQGSELEQLAAKKDFKRLEFEKAGTNDGLRATLARDIADIDDQIKELSRAETVQAHGAAYANLNEAWSKADKKSGFLELQTGANNTRFAQIMPTLGSIYEKCAHLSPDQDRLIVDAMNKKSKNYSGVTLENMMQVFGAVEKGMDCLAAEYAKQCEAKDGDLDVVFPWKSKDKSKCIAAIIASFKCPSTVNASDNNVDEADEDADNRPLMLKELYVSVRADLMHKQIKKKKTAAA